jgi:replication factor A1
VTGRVVAVYPVKNFEGSKPGKFGSVTIVDNDGVLRVVLWNEKANLIEQGELQVGQIVKFVHGYTKADRFNTPEMHIGERSQVELNPQTAVPEDYPSIAKFSSKINEITLESKNVNLTAKVKEIFSPSTFTRGDQSQGKVQRVRISDETGEVVVVFWNEKAEEAQPKLKRGAEVQIVNGRIKTSQQADELEVHVDSASYASIVEMPRKRAKIADLTGDSDDLCVEGEVATLPVTKEVKTSKGEVVKLTAFDLKDETGVVRVTAWREHADSASKLIFGEKIVLENVYAKSGYGGRVELSTRAITIITRD